MVRRLPNHRFQLLLAVGGFTALLAFYLCHLWILASPKLYVYFDAECSAGSAKSLPASEHQGQLCKSDILVYVLSSRATLHRLVDGPYPLWTELQGNLTVQVFTPTQLNDSSSQAILKHVNWDFLDITERADNQIDEYSFEAIRRVYEKYPDKRWYLKIDDDSYLIVPNLLRALAQLNSEELVVGGKFFCPFVDNVLSGGAGYFFSQSMMHQLAKNLHQCSKKNDSAAVPEDRRVLSCIQTVVDPSQLRQVNIPGMYPFNVEDTRQNLVNSALEGLISYPISFHWIKSRKEAEDIHRLRVFDNRMHTSLSVPHSTTAILTSRL